MQIFNNQWLVGVGTGIFSGLFVTLLTGYLFSKRAKKEYQGKILTANHEIIYTLRFGISEGYMPDGNILSALANSTARKYGVSSSDIYPPKQIAEELIKEIMDSSFISTEMKKSYCESIMHLTTDTVPKTKTPNPEEEETVSKNKYHKKSFEIMSILLGIVTASFTMIGILYFSKIEEKFLGYDLTTILTLLYIITLPFIFLTLRKIRSKQHSAEVLPTPSKVKKEATHQEDL